MIINSKDLQGTPVYTKTGISVGKLASINMDAETGKLTEICVSHRGLISGLLSDEFLVSWESIIEITKERILITDTAIPIGVTQLARQSTPSPKPLLKKRSA